MVSLNGLEKMNKAITTTRIAIFRKREIRKTIHNNEWWFVVNDVVLALTDSPNVQDYIKKMRKRDNELSKGWGQIVPTLWKVPHHAYAFSLYSRPGLAYR